MDFLLSKLLWPLATPSNWLGLLIFLCAIGTWSGRRRLAAVSATLAIVIFLPFAAVPVATWFVAPLENRFPAKDLPAKVDGVVVLGGSFRTRLSQDRGAPQVNENSERVFKLIELSRKYPDARILFTGGEAAVNPLGYTESEAAKALLTAIGVPADRVLYEGKSRNTWENALYSKELALPGEGETWLLVTSAGHMPRAMGCFRRAGFPVVPLPVDYQTTTRLGAEATFQFASNLNAFDAAVREWIGLFAYRLLGRTDAFFPGP